MSLIFILLLYTQWLMKKVAIDEVMNMLEVAPSSADPPSTIALSTDIPTHCEQLAVLVSIGKSNKAIGTQLTHNQVKCLTDKDDEKYYKRYESYLGTKTTETLIDRFLMVDGHNKTSSSK